MQATAGAWTNRTLDAVDRGKEVDGNACPEGESTVITPRAEGSRDILRAVVDGVRIRSLRYWHRRSVMAASDSLMINASGLARALGREPRVAVIISVGKLAGDSVKLRGEGSVWAAEMTVVSEQDGIEAQPRKGRALVLPGCGDGFDRIIEGHSQRVVTRLDKGLASVPVNTNVRAMDFCRRKDSSCCGAPYTDTPKMMFEETDLHNAVALDSLEKRKVAGNY
jgi:hypothetical protein